MQFVQAAPMSEMTIQILVGLFGGLLGGAGVNQLIGSFARTREEHADAQDVINKAFAAHFERVEERLARQESKVDALTERNEELTKSNHEMEKQVMRLTFIIRDLRRELEERNIIIRKLNTKLKEVANDSISK